jgi:hypothetical protein
MGRSYKIQPTEFDDGLKGKRKRPNHSNNRKTRGIKIINNFEKNVNNEYKYEYEQLPT